MTRIVIAGGYGLVGGWVARHLRAVGHDVELVLGGRTPESGKVLAAELDASVAHLDTESASADLARIGAFDLLISAVQDADDEILRAALSAGAAHLGIVRKVDNLGPTAMAAADLSRRPALVMGHWQAGTMSCAALASARAFGRIDSISLAALFDPKDAIGPMTANDRGAFFTKALIRRDGKWDRIEQSENIRLVERAPHPAFHAQPMGVLDVAGVATITRVPNLRFDLGMGDSLGTIQGGTASHEIFIDITGTDAGGAPMQQRTVLSNPKGQAHLTALGVLVGAERVLGLDGRPPLSAGLHFAESALDPDHALSRLREFGVSIEIQSVAAAVEEA